MFNKRKPILAGTTYIFDALNESNMASGTSVVTTIKKANKKGHWIVLSANSGDIFECPDNLLTEIADYDAIYPIIRCQYGTTDFSMTDVVFFDVLIDGLNMMAETIDSKEFRELNDKIKAHAEELKTKIKTYASISTYKYNLSVISNIKQAVDKYYKHNTLETSEVSSKSDDKNEIEEANVNMKSIVDNSEFYHKFDEEVKRYYLYEDESMEDFIGNALDLLEEEFPDEAMIPKEKSYNGYISPGDVRALQKASLDTLRSNNMVFLVGMTSKGDQIALCIYNISDFDEIIKFVYTCYDGWINKNDNYYTDHRIVLISVPIRPVDIVRNEDEDE